MGMLFMGCKCEPGLLDFYGSRTGPFGDFDGRDENVWLALSAVDGEVNVPDYLNEFRIYRGDGVEREVRNQIAVNRDGGDYLVQYSVDPEGAVYLSAFDVLGQALEWEQSISLSTGVFYIGPTGAGAIRAGFGDKLLEFSDAGVIIERDYAAGGRLGNLWFGAGPDDYSDPAVREEGRRAIPIRASVYNYPQSIGTRITRLERIGNDFSQDYEVDWELVAGTLVWTGGEPPTVEPERILESHSATLRAPAGSEATQRRSIVDAIRGAGGTADPIPGHPYEIQNPVYEYAHYGGIDAYAYRYATYDGAPLVPGGPPTPTGSRIVVNGTTIKDKFPTFGTSLSVRMLEGQVDEAAIIVNYVDGLSLLQFYDSDGNLTGSRQLEVNQNAILVAASDRYVYVDQAYRDLGDAVGDNLPAFTDSELPKDPSYPDKWPAWAISTDFSRWNPCRYFRAGRWRSPFSGTSAGIGQDSIKSSSLPFAPPDDWF